jgi:hypothetical protein
LITIAPKIKSPEPYPSCQEAVRFFATSAFSFFFFAL